MQHGEVPRDHVNDPFFCMACRESGRHLWKVVDHTFRDGRYDKIHPLDGEIANAEAKLRSFSESQAKALVDDYPPFKKCVVSEWSWAFSNQRA